LDAQLAKSSESQEKQTEAEALLEMAHLAREGEHWEDALVSLSMHLQILRDLGESPSNQALQLHAQAALQTGAVLEALDSLGLVWNNLAPPDREEYAEVVLELTRNLVREQQDEQALPHLQALESHFQENKDAARLDMLYNLLEQVYERGGEHPLLVNAYKRHLEVKRTLDDRPGQGRLLDLLGTHYYQQGDRGASRQYYEDQLRLKSP
jgi:tetratricopeptide (TPR) repeat protein